MTVAPPTGDKFVLDARLLAEAFKLTEDDVKQGMRDGLITSRCEAGIAEDAGRWRLTFYYGYRLSRFIVDERGQVLKRTAFPIKRR